MRIHSDVLTIADVHRAASGLPGVYVTASQHGSRARRRAFNVSLEGNGHRKNSGLYGAAEEFGATWDEWGVFIARLFDIDPEAFWGTAKHPTYASPEGFHHLTGERFRSLELPADTHKRHRWDPAGDRRYSCHTCSATYRIR